MKLQIVCWLIKMVHLEKSLSPRHDFFTWEVTTNPNKNTTEKMQIVLSPKSPKKSQKWEKLQPFKSLLILFSITEQLRAKPLNSWSLWHAYTAAYFCFLWFFEFFSVDISLFESGDSLDTLPPYSSSLCSFSPLKYFFLRSISSRRSTESPLDFLPSTCGEEKEIFWPDEG